MRGPRVLIQDHSPATWQTIADVESDMESTAAVVDTLSPRVSRKCWCGPRNATWQASEPRRGREYEEFADLETDVANRWVFSRDVTWKELYGLGDG